MLRLDTDAGETAAGLAGAVVEASTAADVEAAATALTLVAPRTPRRTGRLAAGLRSDVVPAGGFDLTDPVPYAIPVNARTGFATDTIAAADSTFAAIYERHTQGRLDQVP